MMFRKLSNSQNQLLNFISTLLWEEWDPIGVNDGSDDWPNDEYQNYVFPLFSLAIKGATVNEIAYNLAQVEQERMGLDSDEQKNQLIAEKIVIEARKIALT